MLSSWLKSLRHRQRVESDMDEELHFHIQSYADDLCKRGIGEQEALRRARVEFGALEVHKEECRDSLGLHLWDELRSDLRSGFRVLRQSPLFTAVAIISLALGIGANTAIFSMANEFLLKTMGGVPHPERLRLFTWAQGPKGYIGHVWGSFERSDQGQGMGATFPYPLYQEMRHNAVMEDVAGFKDVQRVTANVGGEAEPVDALLVSGNFYQILGARVEAGRPIMPADDTPTSNAVVVISDSYWSSRFGRSADVLGKTIRLNTVPLTIVGVNDPEFNGPRPGETPQVFFPLSLQAAVIPDNRGPLLSQTNFWWVLLIGRLKPGVSDETAGAALTLAFRNAFHASVTGKTDIDLPRFVLQPGERGFDWGGHRFRRPLYLLLGVAGLVLLIACANLANLLLARATVRQREISLRLAMGADRGRIIRQILTESLLLAFLGGAAGLLLGYWSRNLIPGLILDSWQGQAIDVQMDWRVFAFALGVTAATGLLFGIVPAWRCTQTDANAALKETGRMSTSRPKALFGKALVVFQVALSLLLVVGAGLFLRTLLNLHHAPTGMNTEHIVLFDVNPPRNRYSPAQRVQVFQRIAEGLAAVPGVALSTSSSEPLLAGNVDEDCYRRTDAANRKENTTNLVGADFFATFSIPIVSGRGLNLHDSQAAPRVAVINQALAKSLFPNRNPLGQTVVSCDAGAKPMEIVGVSADAKYTDVRKSAPPTIYIPFAQSDDETVVSRTFEVKAPASLASVVPKLRAVVGAIDKDLPVLQMRTQTQQIDATLTTERIFAILTSGFGGLALILAAIGIYGLMAYTVSRRTNEIGIRMALGAEARTVVGMVVGETSVLAGLGIVAGLLGAFAATRLVASMLFGLQPYDLPTLATGAVLLFMVAMLAAIIPAWRAARVDPMNALRHE